MTSAYDAAAHFVSRHEWMCDDDKVNTLCEMLEARDAAVREEGVHDGMERAARICDERSAIGFPWPSQDAAAIRAAMEEK